MRIAISQSNYIPWKGYFDTIDSVDIFVLYDSVQYTKRDWRNRNIIKTCQGEQMLTIPIKNHSFTQRIDETLINEEIANWKIKHLKSLRMSYGKSEHFKEIFPWIEEIYLCKINNLKRLTDINEVFLKEICSYLGIRTKILRDTDFILSGDKNEKLINICKQLNATTYISGPAARDYINRDLFKKNQLEIEWMDYSCYREYKQLFGGFIHHVSIIDLIFNEGKQSYNYIKKTSNV